jgi:mannose-1-phosphate guanylyltransferase
MAKGMILAAGQGTRVRPLTKDLPKPMIPILGKPVMEYLIEHLASYGITEIMVNVAFHHHKIEQYFGDGHRWGVQIGYAYEGVREQGDIVPKPMGSAGGMRRIQDFSGFFDETTLVLCGDALIDLDIGAALHEHKSKGRHRQCGGAGCAAGRRARTTASWWPTIKARSSRFRKSPVRPRPSPRWPAPASTSSSPKCSTSFRRARCTTLARSCSRNWSPNKLPFFAQKRFFNWIDIGRVSDYWSVLQRVLRGEVAQMNMPGREVRPGHLGGAQHQHSMGSGHH